jgi:hypothetical protein
MTVRLPQLTIRNVNTFAVEVPMTYPLGTSAATVAKAPLLLVDLETEEGVTGRTYMFCYRPSVARAIDVVLRDAVSLVERTTIAPLEIGLKLARRFALPGVSGVWFEWHFRRSIWHYGMRSLSPQVCRLSPCSAENPDLWLPTIPADWD